jgi:hypothetical protein
MSTSHEWDFILGDFDDCPQLAPLAILRAALPTVSLALVDAHHSLLSGDADTGVEQAADSVLRLADRLRLALDNYRTALAREGRNQDGVQVD